MLKKRERESYGMEEEISQWISESHIQCLPEIMRLGQPAATAAKMRWDNGRKERRQKNESWDGSGAGSVFFGVYLLILFFKFIFNKANYNLPVVVWSKFKSLNCNLKFDILPPSSWLKFKLFLCVLKSDVSVMLYCFLSYLILYFYI